MYLDQKVCVSILDEKTSELANDSQPWLSKTKFLAVTHLQI